VRGRSDEPSQVGWASWRSALLIGGEVPVQRRPADPEILGDRLAGMAVELHPFRSADVLGVSDLSGPPEPGYVSARCAPLQGSSLLTLIALAKQGVISNVLRFSNVAAELEFHGISHLDPPLGGDVTLFV
jgi:hypothetical protein